MRLLLLRHGKAEERDESIADTLRRLTDKGRAELDHDLPTLSHYLMTQKNCTVWSSDLARASETAEILVRHMPGIDYDTRSFIETGDVEALIEAIQTFDKNTTLVIVGHEPHLSHWVQVLSGRETTFAKAEFKMLYLDPAEPRKAVFLSRAELNQMDYLQPVDMPVAVGMRLILRRQHDRIVTQRETFLEDPDASEALHMLRVNLRIQRALLSFIKPWADRKLYRKAQSAYRTLFHELTHLREVDVLLETIHNSRNWELQPLILSLMSERNSEALRLSDKLSKRKTQNAYADAFQQTSKALLSVHTEATLSESVPSQMRKRFRQIGKDIQQLDFEDLEAIHKIRISCKTYRYLYERFSALASFDVAQRYLWVRTLHRLLGDYTDAHYNFETLKNTFEDVDDVQADAALDKAMKLYQKKALRQQMHTMEDIRAIQLNMPPK